MTSSSSPAAPRALLKSFFFFALLVVFFPRFFCFVLFFVPETSYAFWRHFLSVLLHLSPLCRLLPLRRSFTLPRPPLSSAASMAAAVYSRLRGRPRTRTCTASIPLDEKKSSTKAIAHFFKGQKKKNITFFVFLLFFRFLVVFLLISDFFFF